MGTVYTECVDYALNEDGLIPKFDMPGNNVNHTNDYLTRVYAQVILETVKKEER